MSLGFTDSQHSKPCALLMLLFIREFQGSPSLEAKERYFLKGRWEVGVSQTSDRMAWGRGTWEPFWCHCSTRLCPFFIGQLDGEESGRVYWGSTPDCWCVVCITVSFEVSSLDTSLLLAGSFLKYNKLWKGKQRDLNTHSATTYWATC